MCGIVGIASQNPSIERAWLSFARDIMTHRGPDDAGEWWSKDGRVGLAHRRLSIIDLSPAGHQPMRLDGQGLTAVFNGEIYNYRELRTEIESNGFSTRSNSDTEVLLATYNTWGTDCLSRLNGMFAFAIYDDRQQQLFLARDRAGEKPLFYRLDNTGFRFASELKALLSDSSLPRKISPEAMACYLAMGYIPGNRCILEGYNKLPPAHALLYDIVTNEIRIWQYWQLSEIEEPSSTSRTNEQEVLEEFEVLLEDAVCRQLVADVPVGILLSGGVDSSLVTAMAVRATNKVRTFTIGFPGGGCLDETEHARLIARCFDTAHMELMAEETTAELIPKLAWQFDEPMTDSSMIPTFMISRLVRQHCTVALGGDGGDELFGGYSHYPRLLWMASRLGWIPGGSRKLVARLAEEHLPVGLKGRNYLQSLGVDLENELPLIALFFDKTTRRRLLPDLGRQLDGAERVFQERVPAQRDLLQRATNMDFQNYLAEDILVKVDRASMLNSLEVRAPFLDYRIVQFAFGKVPSSLKATMADKKILPKKLAAKLLPPEFDKKRKQGFSIPMNQWLKKGPFRELFWSTLTDPSCLFEKRAVQSLLKEQDLGFGNGERLFALVLFELWRMAHGTIL